MKKFLRLFAIVTMSAIALLSLSACTDKTAAYFDSIYAQHENLAASIKSYDSELKEQSSFSLYGKRDRRNNCVTVDLGEVKSFNTITLQEKGKAVTLFSIYASNELDKNYTFIYQGDTIENARVCFTGEVSYRYLRIFAVQVTDSYNVNKIGVYNIKSDKAQDLRVSAYLVIADVDANYDLSTLTAFTDIILFGSAKFDEFGTIKYSYGEDPITKQEITDNGEKYAEKLAIIKAAVAGRDVNIIGDVFLPYLPKGTIYEMLTTNLDNTVKEIKAYVERYDLDGYDIDYEYPDSNKEWRAYNTFLQTVKREMPNKILSIATSPYFLKFDKETVAAIDRVQYMLYDCYDKNGYQAPFPLLADAVRQLKDCGFTENQIDLGLPTYSRPTDNHAFWGNYSDYAAQLGRYNNLIYANTFDHEGRPLTTPQYFNSYQMIADKTAFAIDAGIGGLMMFRVGCDLPYADALCLARAVTDTKTAKNA